LILETASNVLILGDSFLLSPCITPLEKALPKSGKLAGHNNLSATKVLREEAGGWKIVDLLES